MPPTVSSGDLFAEINAQLEEYTEEVDEKLQGEIDSLSKEIVNLLKNHPNIPEKTGKYKKSFVVRTVAKGKGFKRNVVANRKYRLTHLLEDGHLTKNGGRTRAFPHWKDAQEMAETLPERLEKKL